MECCGQAQSQETGSQEKQREDWTEDKAADGALQASSFTQPPAQRQMASMLG